MCIIIIAKPSSSSSATNRWQMSSTEDKVRRFLWKFAQAFLLSRVAQVAVSWSAAYEDFFLNIWGCFWFLRKFAYEDKPQVVQPFLLSRVAQVAVSWSAAYEDFFLNIWGCFLFLREFAYEDKPQVVQPFLLSAQHIFQPARCQSDSMCYQWACDYDDHGGGD